jgi:serine acetyltransferase
VFLGQVCVNIGTQAGHTFLAPKIEDIVYIRPGARIFGPNISIAGVPARKISETGSEGLMRV